MHKQRARSWSLGQEANTMCIAGLDCDMSIASTGARFKSTVLRYLCGIDWRFAALVRLVKLWAGTCGMNDATAGTFNSFALTLMVGCAGAAMQSCIWSAVTTRLSRNSRQHYVLP